MRTVAAALLLALFAGACRQSAPVAPEAAPPAEWAEPRPEELVARFRRGDAEAEARLAALGEHARPWLAPFLDAGDRDLRLRTLSVLLSAGGDIGITERERVEVLVHDLHRDAPPYVALRAAGLLRSLEEDGRAHLAELAGGAGPDAEAARRLLRSWTP